jgi:hypothetical protein
LWVFYPPLARFLTEVPFLGKNTPLAIICSNRGDVYLDSSRTHLDHEAWLFDSGASFHMTPHKEWLCEYERYDGGNVFLGDDSTTRIIGKVKFKLRLIYGRIRTLYGVLHIPALAKNLISVRK